MYTFGYSFKTWKTKIICWPSILKYINEAADEYHVKDRIIYEQKALSYNFDTKEKKFGPSLLLDLATAKENVFTCNFIFSCSGITIMIKDIHQHLKINRCLKAK
jgi:cation diffusion facilitator CzcD-associated flavoprotein CzcO